MKAFKALPRFRGNSRLGTWLYRIAHNACLDELRRSRRTDELPADLPSRAVDPGDLVARRGDLARALAALPSEERAAVLLVDAQGFDYRQSAHILGIPEGTVASGLKPRANSRRQIRIEQLAIDPPVDRDDLTLDFPPDAKPSDFEHGVQRVELGQIGQIVGYDPLVPAWLPEGYRPTEVAAHPGIGPTGVEGSNPPSTDVVSLSFRRGLDQMLVTTRRRDVAGWPDAWTDLLATGEGYRDRPERVVLSRGALSGVEARLLLVPRNVPDLWALADEVVVTVSGALSRAVLVRVAESLEPRS